jgi:hypothetical protein
MTTNQYGVVSVEILPSLGTVGALEHLLEQGQRGRLVGWGIWRQMNEALRDIGPRGAEVLSQELPLNWQGFTLRVYNRDQWMIRRGDVKATIWDLWQWAKRPPAEGESPRALYLAIKEAGRHFGVKPRGFHGLGNLASPILRANGVMDHTPDFAERLPWAQADWSEAVAAALFGGRIQSVRIGHAGQAWEYDLNSAYARGLINLPSLRGAEWYGCAPNFSEKFWGLYEVEWDIPEHTGGRPATPIYPFPVRRRNGIVEYPRQGRGTFWSPIVKEALKHWPQNVRVHSTRVLVPTNDAKPFSFIAKLYEKRQATRNNLTAKIMKWVLAALWGKLCQRPFRNHPAEFHCQEWAGMATSWVNAQLLKTAMIDPRRVWMFQVDSLITVGADPFPVDLGTGLGQWKRTRYERLQAYQPGFWRGETEPGLWKSKTRGVPEGCFDWSEAEREWQHFGAFGRVKVAWEEFAGLSSFSSSGSEWLSTRQAGGVVFLRPGGFKSYADLAKAGAGGNCIWKPPDYIDDSRSYSAAEGYRIDHNADTAQERL